MPKKSQRPSRRFTATSSPGPSPRLKWRCHSDLGIPVFWISHTQIPSEMGIPTQDTQNTDSYTDKRLEEARSFCRLSPLFNTSVFVINFGAMS